MAATKVTCFVLVVTVFAVLCRISATTEPNCRTKYNYNDVWPLGITDYVIVYHISADKAERNFYDTYYNFHETRNHDATFVYTVNGRIYREDFDGTIDENDQFYGTSRLTGKRTDLFIDQRQPGQIVVYLCEENRYNYTFIAYDINRPQLKAAADAVAVEVTNNNLDRYRVGRKGC